MLTVKILKNKCITFHFVIYSEKPCEHEMVGKKTDSKWKYFQNVES